MRDDVRRDQRIAAHQITCLGVRSRQRLIDHFRNSLRRHYIRQKIEMFTPEPVASG